MTNYNTLHTVRQSLESLLSQIDERFEIIVVDNQSKDGSLEILKEYKNKKRIRLIVRHCSRGLGRKIAIGDSVGEYVICQMDMDDVFEPKLNELLKIYHAYFEGFMLLVQGVPGMMIAPKKLIEKVGGYRDLNYLEDKDLYSRIAQLGRFKFLESFKIVAYSITVVLGLELLNNFGMIAPPPPLYWGILIDDMDIFTYLWVSIATLTLFINWIRNLKIEGRLKAPRLLIRSPLNKF